MSYEFFGSGPLQQVNAVLFDMDGLVLDTEKLYSRFWQEACVALGYPMTREQSLTMRALNSKAGEANLKRFFGPSVIYQQVRSLRIRLMDAYIEEHGVDLKPGIRELLACLKDRKIPTALDPFLGRGGCQGDLTPMGLYDSFQCICSGYEVPHGKPEPDIFLHAAKCLHQDPGSCMVLEDSPAGILAASRAGCLPVMIPDLDQPEGETRTLLYARADSLLDIIDLIP